MPYSPNGTCPVGSGSFYTCTESSPYFVGCCNSNPCNNSGLGCPASDFIAAGTGAAHDVHFSPKDIICSQGLFWTCANQLPTFQGCCDADHDPCGGDGAKGGCPASKLHPMRLAHPQAVPAMSQTSMATQSTVVLPPTTVSISVVITTSASSTTSTTSTSGTSDPGSPTQSSSADTKNAVNIPAIAGGVGGAVLVLTLIALLFLWRRKTRNRQNAYAYPQSPTAFAEDKFGGYSYDSACVHQPVELPSPQPSSAPSQDCTPPESCAPTVNSSSAQEMDMESLRPGCLLPVSPFHDQPQELHGEERRGL